MKRPRPCSDTCKGANEEPGALGGRSSREEDSCTASDRPQLSMNLRATAQGASSTLGDESTEQKTCFRIIERGRLQEVHVDVAEDLGSPVLSSGGDEYRSILRMHYLRNVGLSVGQVASELRRPESWVHRWWDRAVKDLSRPPGVPKYIVDYELRMLQSGVEPFRAPELRRGYAQIAGLYHECLEKMPWRQAVIRRRDYGTGDLAITDTAANRQDCMCAGMRTGIQRLDAVLERMKRDFKIEDPHVHLVNNWYPDGRASIGAHSHDHWSAILSLGAPRLFILDDKPILVADGDVIIFGTQRHSLPKMPDVRDGRISVGMFWYPEKRPACARCGLQDVLLQEAQNGDSFCELCWAECLQHASATQQQQQNDDARTEDEMLAMAIQMSLAEQ